MEVNERFSYSALEFIPEIHKNEELCLKSVKKYGYTLKFVPQYKKTYEICLEAI